MTSPAIDSPRAETPAAPGRRAVSLPLALVTALLGFLLATQFQAGDDLNVRLAGEREADLARILSDLTISEDQVRDEIVELRVRLESARGAAGQEQILIDAARQQVDALRIMLGLVAAKGPGIVARVSDPEGAVGPDVLLDAIEELRDAGAEAIDVNGVRIVASSAFGGAPGGVTISGTRIGAPYEISAIGGAETLDQALRIPGGVVDSIGARDGATIVIEQRRELRIASLRPAPRFTYASPS